MKRSVYLAFVLSISLVVSPVLALDEAFESAADARPEILERYFEASKSQEENLHGLQMEMSFDAKMPKLHKEGKLRALRFVSKLGKITFNTLSFTGDSTIKKEVIARFLQMEQDSGEKASDMSISEKNYKFKYKKSIQSENRPVYVYELTPREKKVGLFKGELWIDSATYMPVRESGRLVKSPSVFLKKVEFVREYVIKDGIAVPKMIKSLIETRLAGKAELDINDLAFYDPLTKLPNRRLLRERLQTKLSAERDRPQFLFFFRRELNCILYSLAPLEAKV